MCRLRNIAIPDYQESVTTGQIDTQRRWTKLSLCSMYPCASQATQPKRPCISYKWTVHGFQM